MAPLYRPPTRVTTLQVPYQALVVRADPEFERRKHREIDYEFSSGKVFLSDPYHRGAYATPTKSTTVNYTTGTTFAAGDLTGSGFDFVKLISTNAAPGTLTTRTAAQMFTDIPNDTLPQSYYLRISNTGGGTDVILAGGAGISLTGNMNIQQNTYSDFVVQFTDSSHARIITETFGNNIHSIT